LRTESKIEIDEKRRKQFKQAKTPKTPENIKPANHKKEQGSHQDIEGGKQTTCTIRISQ
jgi:hypothetical protein